MTNEIIDSTNKLIKPDEISTSDNDVIKELSDNLQGITPEDVDTMCTSMDEAEKKEKEEQETKERNVDMEKVSPTPPEYTEHVRENFLNLKGIDRDKLQKIDEFVSDLEKNGCVKRCSFELGLLVLIKIPGYPAFKYFEPNFRKHSLNASYRGFGPLSKEIPSKIGDNEIMKSEVKCGGIGVLPIRTSKDVRDNDILYYYLVNTMKENNFYFVSFQHDRKLLKILGEYYVKETGDSSITTDELVAMRTRVLLSSGFWLEKHEGGFTSGMIRCYDDHCGFDLFGFPPDEFDYVSFFLTDLELGPEDYANGYDTKNILN